MESKRLKQEPANELEETLRREADTERKTSIGVYLLLENRFMGDALVHVLRRREDLEVVGRGAPKETTAEAIAHSGCDVVVQDFADRIWLEALRNASKKCGRAIRAIAIGMGAGTDVFLEAVCSGITGYLLKDASACDVVSAVRSAVRGEATCPPQLCATLFQQVARMEHGRPRRGSRDKFELTVRQQKLMELVAQGLTNKEISKELGLSEYTVRNHISRILRQLDAESRSEAVEVAREYGYEMRL
jgi:DNA-binding NarL/FixJ family response regulator